MTHFAQKRLGKHLVEVTTILENWAFSKTAQIRKLKVFSWVEILGGHTVTGADESGIEHNTCLKHVITLCFGIVTMPLSLLIWQSFTGLYWYNTTTDQSSTYDHLTIHGQTCLVRTSCPWSTAPPSPCLTFPFIIAFFFPFFLLLFFLPSFVFSRCFDLAGNASLFTKPFWFWDVFLFFLAFLLCVEFLLPFSSFLLGLWGEGASSGSTEGRCFGPLVPLTPHTETLKSRYVFEISNNIDARFKMIFFFELTALLSVVKLVICCTLWRRKKIKKNKIFFLKKKSQHLQREELTSPSNGRRLNPNFWREIVWVFCVVEQDQPTGLF